MDYSDNTPDISYTYDSFVRSTTVADAIGTGTMAYHSDNLALTTESVSEFYDSKATRSYDSCLYV